MTIKLNTAFYLRIVFLAVLMQGYLSLPDFRRLKSSNHRQIEPFACYQPGTREEGICMFSWTCSRANGTHLTFCTERFYFGSCCKLPPEYYIIQESTTTSVPSGLTTNASKLSSGKPELVGQAVSSSTSTSVLEAKLSTEGKNDSMTTKAAYHTVTSFPPGLVTWRPLEAPHEVPEHDKTKPTAPIYNTTITKVTTPHATKTKISTKQPFPSYPTALNNNKKTKPTISHAAKDPKPTQSNAIKVPRPTAHRPVTTSTRTTPKKTVRPRPTVPQGVKVRRPTPSPATEVLRPKTQSTVRTSRPTMTPQTVKVPRPSTLNTMKISRPTVPPVVKVSKPTVPHLQKVTQPVIPNEILSSKPQSVKFPHPGAPHEGIASKPTVQNIIKTPKPTVDLSNMITLPPVPSHIVEMLRPQSSRFPEIQKSTVSAAAEKTSTTVENMLMFTFPPFPGPVIKNLTTQQPNLKINSSESSLIEVKSTETAMDVSTSQATENYITTQTTQTIAVAATTSVSGAVGEVVEVTNIYKTEATSEDPSVESTSYAASGQEESGPLVSTTIEQIYPTTILDHETEDSDISTEKLNLANDTKTLPVSLSDITSDSSLNEITENYETDSSIPIKQSQANRTTSPALPTTTLAVFHSTQTSEEVQSRQPDSSDITVDPTEIHTKSFSTTPFKCKTSTQDFTTKNDFINLGETSTIQHGSQFTGTTEASLTEQSSSLNESDGTRVTSFPDGFVSHVEPGTTEESHLSSVPETVPDSTLGPISEADPGYAGSTEGDVWNQDYGFSGTTETQEQHQSSDSSTVAEAGTKNHSALSWTSETAVTQEHQVSSEMPVNMDTQLDSELFETYESSGTEDSAFSGITKIYFTEMASQQGSTEKEQSHSENDIYFSASTSDIKLNNISQASTFEYESDSLTSTKHIETTSPASKLTVGVTEISLNTTHPEIPESPQTTEFESTSIKKTASFEDKIHTSTVLGDETSSERYVHSSLESISTDKTESIPNSSTESTTVTEILSSAGEIQDVSAELVKDPTYTYGQSDNKIPTALPFVISKTSVDEGIAQGFTDYSVPATRRTQTIQPLVKVTTDEIENLESLGDDSDYSPLSFTTNEEKTQNQGASLTDKYETKLEILKTTLPGIATSQHPFASDATADVEDSALSNTVTKKDDSLSFVSQSSFITDDSYDDTNPPATHPNTASTHFIPNLSETFSVDINFASHETSLSETESTTYTKQNTDTTSSDQHHEGMSDITMKYVTSSITSLDPDYVTHPATTPAASSSQEDASTKESSVTSSDAGIVITATTPKKNTSYVVEDGSPWADIAAGVIEMLQGVESHSSSPRTTSPPPVKSSVSSTTSTPVPKTTSEINLSSADYTQVCGRPLPGPVGRIVGGGPAHFGEWPWVVSLRQWKKNTFLHKCGAALVNEFWAITAAHCVEGVPLTDILLRLGEYDITHEEEPLPFVERRVQIVAAHPKFDKRTFEYDLALLRFYEPVTFQRNVIPVCIPDGNNSYVGKFATVTGWGRLYEDGPLPNVIQEVALPVITNTLCEEMYRKAGFVEDIPDIFICAGYGDGGKDSCEGDSGGPMVIQEDDGRWVLAGVISWGIGCALPNQPGVYTRITKFSEWINQIVIF